MSDLSTARNVIVIAGRGAGVWPAHLPSPPRMRGRDGRGRAGGTPAVPAYLAGSGSPCERPRFCISKMFTLKPLPMIMSPGFGRAAGGRSHLAAIVIVMLPPGRASLCDVTVIV